MNTIFAFPGVSSFIKHSKYPFHALFFSILLPTRIPISSFSYTPPLPLDFFPEQFLILAELNTPFLLKLLFHCQWSIFTPHIKGPSVFAIDVHNCAITWLHLLSGQYVDAEFVWNCQQASHETGSVVHHLAVVAHSTLRTAAMSVASVVTMRGTAIGTAVDMAPGWWDIVGGIPHFDHDASWFFFIGWLLLHGFSTSELWSISPMLLPICQSEARSRSNSPGLSVFRGLSKSKFSFHVFLFFYFLFWSCFFVSLWCLIYGLALSCGLVVCGLLNLNV